MSFGGGNVVGEAVYEMSVDDTKFTRGLQNADREAQNVGKSIGGLGAIGIGVFSGLTQSIATLGLSKIGDLFGFMKGAVVGMNAELQSSTLQFETLFGDAQRAEEHVASLFEFAKKTPFETGPIIQASRLLRTFGGDALNSEKMLNLVGDAAAGASQGFDEVAFWTGRAYAAIQGGQPFGEAAARLQEMALLTPAARKEMEDLQKSGASADEVFAVLEGTFGKFSGSMDKMSGTWSGLTSTFSDTVNILIATAFRPFFGVLSDSLAGINTFLGSDAVAQFSEMFAEGIADGLNVVISGMRRFIGIVLDVGGAIRGALGDLVSENGIINVLFTRLALLGDPALFGTSALAGFGNTFSAVMRIARDGVNTLIQALQGDWTNSAAILPFHQRLGEIGSTIYGIVNPALNALRDAIGFVQENFGAIKTVLQDLLIIWAGPWISALRGAVEGFGKDGIAGILPGAIDGLENFGQAIGRVAEFLGRIFKETDWGAVVDALLTTLGTSTGALLSGLTSFFSELFGSVDWLELGSDVLDGIVEGISAAFGTGVDLGSRFLTFVSDQFGAIDWGEVGSTVVGLLADGFDTTVDLASMLVDPLVEAFNDIDWLDIGGDIVGGILDGVLGIASFGQDVGQWIIDEISAIEFLELGSDLIDGIVAGATAVADFGSRMFTWIYDEFVAIEWTDLGTSIVDGIITAVTSVADVATRFGTWLYNAVLNIQWTEIGATIVNGVVTAVTAVADFATRLGTWLLNTFNSVDWSGIATSIQDGIGNAISTGKKIAVSIETQIASFDWGAAGTAISDGVGSSLDFFGKMDLSGITSAMQPLIDAFDPLLAILEPMFAIIRATITALIPLWEALVASIIPFLNSLKALEPLLKPIAIVIGTFLVVAVAALVLGVAALAVVIAGVLIIALKATTIALETTGFVFKTLATLIEGLVKTVIAVFKGDWSGALDIMRDTTERANQAVVQFFEKMKELVLGTISGLVSGIIDFFMGLYNDLVGNSIIPDLINGIVDWFLDLPGRVITIVSDFVGSVLGFFTDLVVEGVKKAEDLVTGVIDSFIDLFVDGPKYIWDTVKAVVGYLEDLVRDGVAEVGKFVDGVIEWVGGLPGKAITALGDVAGILTSAGEDIMNGLWEGLKSVWGDITGWFTEITDAIPDWKGPESADKKLLFNSGQYVMQGFNAGLESEWRPTEQTLNNITTGVGETFNDGISDIELDDTAPIDTSGITEPFETAAGEISDSGNTVRDAFDGLAAAMGFIEQATELQGISFEGMTDFIDRLATLTHDVLDAMGEVAGDLSGEFLDHVGKASSAISGAIGALGQALSFATTAQETGGVDFAGLATLMDNLRDLSAYAVRILGEAASQFSDEFIEQAGKLSGAVGSAMGILQQGMDFVKAAGELGSQVNFEQVTVLASDLKHLIEHIAKSIGDSAAYIAEIRTEDFLAGADEFAINTRSSVELMTSGLGFLSALQDLGEYNLDAVKSSASALKVLIEHVVRSIGDTAAVIALERPEGFLGAAELFATAAERAIGTITQALGFISAMAQFDGQFDLAGAREFATGLKWLVEHIVLSLGDTAAYIAELRPETFLKSIQTFADAVTPAITILSDTINLIATFSTIPRGSFSTDFALLIGQLSQIAQMAAEGIEHVASVWGDTVNPQLTAFHTDVMSGFGILTGVMDALTQLSELDTAVFGMDLALLLGQLTQVARMIADEVTWASDTWRDEVNPKLSAFAADVGAGLGIVSGVIDFIRSVSGSILATDAASGLAGALVGVATVVAEAVQEASAAWSDKADPALKAFSEDATAGLGLMGSVIGVIKSILELRESADGKPLDVKGAVPILTGAIETMITAIQDTAQLFQDSGLDALEDFSAAAGAGLALMSSAVSLVNDIMGISKLRQRDIDNFVGSWELVIAGIERISGIIESRGLNVAQKTLEDVQKMATALTEAMVLMNQISGDFLSNQGIATPSIESPSVTGASPSMGSGGSFSAGGGSLAGARNITIPVHIGNERLETIVVDTITGRVRVQQ